MNINDAGEGAVQALTTFLEEQSSSLVAKKSKNG